MASIHPTAIIGEDVQLGVGVFVGPYAVIEDHVKIGDGCSVGAHALIHSYVSMGRENKIYPFCDIGGEPQDIKFENKESWVVMGDRNLIREYATIHRSSNAGGKTVLGNDNFLMGHAHIGHDCQVGDHVVMVNFTALGGYVTVEDRAFISASCLVHQFCKIGTLVMLGGASHITQDVIPYTLVGGYPPRIFGLNIVGLRRAGFDRETRSTLKEALSVIRKSSSREEMLKTLEGLGPEKCPELAHLIAFINKSERGLLLKENG
ncbi:MAG TPA: acyl-ACP--UDP-N-acetylglucosamine O-acyltransferase [Candidatus Mcinerneyibacteriales bacterium]|nr:acyl-ACP--UDP-N-acetylglucosamine O-acyltransferase [Candidatus Mcinerneyibacteriales bacterium]HPJ70264.1 acyl-ACP--UDP-N-acetylglucosamine O-acyltransferase [Candidatus Mcinerneyibacteriales bacterium]HPQ89579.1 acyl-ACP--UDP-N-acetylglucosamine O-acyltransferase [Candidatus Mcinerneyibacteriales bacterium]